MYTALSQNKEASIYLCFPKPIMSDLFTICLNYAPFLKMRKRPEDPKPCNPRC
jgi:hypothetical protein